MSERFRPPPHTAPDTGLHKLAYAARLLLDFQFRTIHGDMKKFLPGLSGTLVDVGAGHGPFRHLLRPTATQYIALDIYGAGHFGYADTHARRFDGERIPLESSSVDHFICTEVLEHVENPLPLVGEMHRILKPGGNGVITVPWAARYHYIPYDYHRFTPSRLAAMCSMFSAVTVEPRGTDLTVIVSKVIVAYARLLTPRNSALLLITLLPALVLAPVVGLLVVCGHVSLLLGLGSTDDPLGYTVWVRKHD